MVWSLVPGRQCGSCTACCVTLPIVETDIAKPSNLMCVHCGPDGGCAIYERRPEVCRTWFCGWRMMPELDEGWRPDRSGFLVKIDRETDLIFMITGDPVAVSRQRFVSATFDLIGRGVPVELALPGPPGYFANSISLNELLADVVERRDHAAAREKLANIVETLAASEWKSDGIEARYP